jgi:DNA-binding transcriptional LysR family regulator
MGAVVLERARTMINDLDHLAREMEAVASGHAAHLRIGVIPFISGQMLSAALKPLQSGMEQRLTVTIHEGTSDQLLLQLQDHTVDIVIGRASAVGDLNDISLEILFRQQPRMIANRRLAAKLSRNKLDWNKRLTLYRSYLPISRKSWCGLPVSQSFLIRLNGHFRLSRCSHALQVRSQRRGICLFRRCARSAGKCMAKRGGEVDVP